MGTVCAVPILYTSLKIECTVFSKNAYMPLYFSITEIMLRTPMPWSGSSVTGIWLWNHLKVCIGYVDAYFVIFQTT